MTVIVFLGPTLPIDTARAHLDGCYLPPVQQGDVLRALSHNPRVIAIIDGYFDLVPSVWHKEILVALSRGVHVFGASSMGALRAAELHQFGMIGVGEIFQRFIAGELEDDDEVAVLHGPAESGFIPMSDAMVDIRDALAAAVADGVVDAGLADRLTRAAKRMHYRERTLRRVLLWARQHGEDARIVDDLAAFLAGPRTGAKARDAIALLEAVSIFLDTDPPPLRVAWTLQRTHYLRALEHEVAGQDGTRIVCSRGVDRVPRPVNRPDA